MVRLFKNVAIRERIRLEAYPDSVSRFLICLQLKVAISLQKKMANAAFQTIETSDQ